MFIVFYTHFEHSSIKLSITVAVLHCLNTGSFPPSINHTFISLTPKVKSPKRVSIYHPIASCNILYKLISKVLANKLKRILPHVVLESQSAF